MGKSQRDKGKRGEYALRDALRLQGWTADRVPSSGAAQGFKGDVAATHPKYGRKLFELKCRKDTFKNIYALYDAHCRKAQDDLLAIAVPGAEALCLSVSSSLEAVMDGADVHVLVTNHPLYADYKRTFKKIENLEKLLGECEILVIKDDRKPFLYLRWL